MGWFADSMRLRDVINVVTSIEIPLPAACDPGDGTGNAVFDEGEGGDAQAA